MAGQYEKEFKKAIKAEIAPLLVGLRREMAGVGKILKKLEKKKAPTEIDVKVKDFPDVQRVETVNPQKEVSVKNFPEAIRVKGIKLLLRGVTKFFEDKEQSIGKSLLKHYLSGVKQLKSHVFKVEVSNQTEVKFPEVQEVDFVEEIYTVLKGLKQAEVQRVKIENSTPGEAVPVVLTSKDKKKFYNAISEVVRALGGGGGRPDVRDLAQKASDEGHTYTFATGILSSANNQNENEIILLRNPAGSKRILRIEEFNFQSDGNIIIFVNVYKAPTVTDTGTPITINKTRSDGKPNLSEAFFGPTASDFGAVIKSFVLSTGTASFIFQPNLKEFLLEGEDVLVTIQKSSASASSVSFAGSFVEEPK